MYQLIVFAPLLGAIIAGVAGTRFGSQILSATLSKIITTGLLFLSAILSWVVFMGVGFGDSPDQTIQLFRWMEVGDMKADWALKIDTLTAVMLVVVNSVSALVHLYSWGYMSDDKYQPRFFAYLSLFTFAMLMLVTSDNFIQLFFGWEGVGLASYLLIGYYYKKPSANAAAIKAFVTNRVGDVGLALGIMTIFLMFGSVNFDVVFAALEGGADTTLPFLGGEFNAIELIAFLLFIGAMGKSAQFVLHVWLPDAMEGPTPVSALIHAATMVTAGVFLVCRAHPIFELAPFTSGFITTVGAFTALFAASVALVQNDIKRVIAYSTCSQLGYMFFAAGVGAYNAAMFHLFTHAFFKALLFLCAGSVIHALHHEQDMRKMGGIWRKVPWTYGAMIIGTLAITGIGIPGSYTWGFAGFFSKDAIIEAAYSARGSSDAAIFAFWIGITAALMTSFYSWRLIFMTFHGKFRGDQHTLDHAHESPWNMRAPLVLLSLGAIFAGAIFHKYFMKDYGAFWHGALPGVAGDHHAAISNTLYAAAETTASDATYGKYESKGFIDWLLFRPVHGYPFWVLLLPLVASVTGFVIAYFMYIRGSVQAKIDHIRETGGSPLYNFLLNKWYIDELYDATVVRGTRKLGDLFWKVGDVRIIDGLGPNGVAKFASGAAKRVSKFQTGYLYHYAFVMLLGVAFLILVAFRGTTGG
ncbi:NADH:ubiquinone oxidoreductase subunit L [Litorimonas cladophorae]|uniref:NADH:ubiquinone oxidoreductase subunit L n=1 Tax=Litorimonas cladophorae TaxID=1220491 RepID=A0A918NA18_9PROT|nr:NADH-quinone oxidoreductase subunit L [Litorimonas cladophorae]GGX57560.1 NADH:ubiquinone oxidoreductase subunit L [Litorimonas cladophorae]